MIIWNHYIIVYYQLSLSIVDVGRCDHFNLLSVGEGGSQKWFKQAIKVIFEELKYDNWYRAVISQFEKRLG